MNGLRCRSRHLATVIFLINRQRCKEQLISPICQICGRPSAKTIAPADHAVRGRRVALKLKLAVPPLAAHASVVGADGGGTLHLELGLQTEFCAEDGSTTERALPAPRCAEVSRLRAAEDAAGGLDAIAAAGDFSLALASGGAVYTFGRNAVGQLGHGHNATMYTPASVDRLQGRRPLSPRSKGRSAGFAVGQ